MANIFFKNKQFAQSVDAYRKALLVDDLIQQDKARYNLAVALFYYGLDIENEDIERAIGLLEEALNHYDELRLTGGNADVDFNYPIVEKELSRMKNQLSNQKNSKDQKHSESQDTQDSNKKESDQDSEEQKVNQNEKNNGDSSQKDQQNQNNSGNDQQNQNNNQEDESEVQQQDKDESSTKEDDSSGAERPKADSFSNEDQSSKNQQSLEKSDAEKMQILTKDEARMMLEDYEQNKEPKGMINFIKRKDNVRGVSQDW